MYTMFIVSLTSIRRAARDTYDNDNFLLPNFRTENKPRYRNCWGGLYPT